MSPEKDRELILAVLKAESGRVRGAKFAQTARSLVPNPAKDVDTSNVFKFPSEKKKSDDGRDG